MNPLVEDKIEELLASISTGDGPRLGRFLRELLDTKQKDLEDFFQGLTVLLVEIAGELLGCDISESYPETAGELGERAISTFGDLVGDDFPPLPVFVLLGLQPDKQDFQEYAGSLLASMTGAVEDFGQRLYESKTLGDLDPISLMLLMALILVGLFCLQDDSWKDLSW